MFQVPRLEKFCVCMDVPTGVRNFTIVLVVLWILYFIAAFSGTNSTSTGCKNTFSIKI